MFKLFLLFLFLCVLYVEVGRGAGFPLLWDKGRPTPIEEDLPCRFAPLFTQEELLNDDHKREQFIQAVLRYEAHFHAPGVGYHYLSGHTFDGHDLNYTTGGLAPPLHYWSAPSKEAIHVGILALALAGNERAELFLNSSSVDGDGRRLAIDLLTKKINTYYKWNATYPGFGGFMPWVFVYDWGIVPATGWENQVPGLDNGEWIWSLMAAQWALSRLGPKYKALADQYQRYIQMLADNSITVFYDGGGRIRCVTKILNTSALPFPGNYETSGWCYLDDPYEGELFAVFMYLYGRWHDIHEAENIWIYKRGMLQSVDYPTPHGPITCQRGYWFSAHEQWKYLELPYMDIDINRRVFMNGERARTWNSALNYIPGLYASVNDVSKTDVPPDYISATGIQEIAFQKVLRRDVVTPYATTPLWLAAGDKIGSVWYHLMISGGHMQGPFGSTEAININATAISPVLTWDSKITTVLAIMGGLSPITREVLKETKMYDRFTAVIQREWNRAFPVLHGENLSFALPTASLPGPGLGDFTLCSN